MAAVTTVPLIPLEVLFGNPVRTQPKLSPDGTKLSFIAPMDGVLNVWVGAVDSEIDSFKPITSDKVRGIRSYFWARDSRRILYLQDTGGDENWRLYAVDLETLAVSDLTPFENVQVRILDVNHDYPNRIIVGINKDNIRAHDVYSLDLNTGELVKLLTNPGDQIDWGIDHHQNVRVATVSLPDSGQQLQLLDSSGPEPVWTEFVSWGPDDSLSSGLAGFTSDSKSVYLIDSAGVNAGRLTERPLDLSGEPKVILEDPEYDVSGLVQHPVTHTIQAVAVTRDKTEWTFFDSEFAADITLIAETVSGELSVSARDQEDKLWIVAATSDIGSPRYYYFDRATKALRLLFSVQPEFDNYTLAPMEPIEFQSRDDFTVHGYLTVPVGVDPTNLPLVLNVHGGPWHRDAWGLRPEAQWLANRGYACLQVNYRGSTGYGKAFLNAGNKEWGGKMHDDLVDAVQWAVDSGIADPKRIAIYGGSYGGYAALVGATFTPDLFRCAVDIVGPSNLITFIHSIPPYWSAMLSTLHRRVGNPETEPEFLISRSPLSKVDQIKIPMLIAQGANDPRVKQAESEQIVAAMKAKGIDHDYLLFSDEGHGFARPENRLKFYTAAETFLAKHLGSL